MEAVIKDIQDTLTVMVELERRQSKMLREHSERLVSLEDEISEHRRESARLQHETAEFQKRTDQNLAEITEFQKRTDQNLAEITDKLNGLIGYVSNWKQPPQQPT